MVVRVLDVEWLVMHYLWVLKDFEGVRDQVDEWGFDVKEEERLCGEAREVLCRMRMGGRKVL